MTTNILYFVLAQASVLLYALMAGCAYIEGDWRRGTTALLFAAANAVMFVF